MALSSTVSSKGQITIPIEIRRRLGLKEGARVDFVEKDGETMLRPARGVDNPFAKYAGALAGLLPDTIEGIIREERLLRGHAPEPAAQTVKRGRSR